MKPNVKQHRKSNSWTVLGDSSVWMMDKEKRHRTHFSFGQAMALAAICASTAAALTAMVAVYFFSNSTTDYYADRVIASTSRSIISRTRVRPFSSPPHTSGWEASAGMDAENENSQESSFPLSVLPSRNLEDEGPRPHIVWLMSFPNRSVHVFLCSTDFWIQSSNLSSHAFSFLSFFPVVPPSPST